MLRELKVENFRAFRRFSVSGFERINLIAGKNNSGKTALLEAIHVLGNPSRSMLLGLLNEQRGIIRKDPLNSGKWLFLDGDLSHKIEIETSTMTGRQLHVSVEFVDGTDAQAAIYAKFKMASLTLFPIEVWASNSPRVLISASNGNGKLELAAGIYQKSGGILSFGSIQPIRPSIFITSLDRAVDGLNQVANDVNELFSEIEAAGRQDELLSVLRHLEPRLEALVLLSFGGETTLHGKVGGGRPMPVALMGEGFRRVLFLSLVIAIRPGSIVLIDEIENGLHYSVISTIWKAIGDAARNSDVQVFATTHSWECIRSAYDAFSEQGESDFRLIRLDRYNGSVAAISYDQEMIATALLAGVEMR